MRRRRIESAGTSISLFPFLAVLICTMGVLITLLVVASKAAEVHQQKANDELTKQLAAQQEELNFEQQEAELKLEVLTRSRPDLKAKLTQSRLRRSHIEDELRQLEQRFAQLADLSRVLSDESNEKTLSAKDVEELQRQVATAETELETAEQQRAAHPSSYAIVTQPTFNGTLRRPIYIECTAREIIIQPAGVVIPTAELTPPILPGNSLDTALLTVREYWTKNNLAGEHGEPYPLLVVRPDGAQSYALARRAMQSWTDEFGYELIDQDLQIDFGEADPNLVAALESTLRVSRAQYASLRQIAQSARDAASADLEVEGLRVSREGGFEPIGGAASMRGMPKDVASSESNTADAPNKADRRTNSNSTVQASTKDPTSPTQGAASPLSGSVVPLAQSRGENWALPAHHSNAIAYRRSVVISCDAQALTLDGGTGANVIRIPWTNDEQSIDQLVSTIWQVIESWGIAERNGYWKPELRIVVAPDGQATFERMQILMQGSGFNVMRTEFR